jgi:hypothetical protein
MEVNELGTQEKDVFGKGLEHTIYPSLKDPNILFKVGEMDVISQWYELFLNNPNIFAKVYGMGKIPNSGYFFVKIEKLDTKKFESNWDKLEESLEELGILDVDRGENFSDIYLNYGSDSEKIREILIELKSHDTESYKFFVELITLMKMAEKAQDDFLKKSTVVDTHKYNLGYSKDGKIKFLDV